jgi:hypothetical protein
MNADALASRLQIFRSKRLRLLVDTNLLLLYFVGGFRRELIRSFKRTHEFSEDDFVLLAQIMHYFGRVTTTPHILTEVSNFLSQHHEPERSALLKFLGDSIVNWNEENLPAKRLVRACYFPRFGLTDAGIIDVSQTSYLVLTNERPLVGFLTQRKSSVLHFQELQTLCL